MNILDRLKEQLDCDAIEYLQLARLHRHTLQIIQTVQSDGTVLPPRFSIDTRTEKPKQSR